MKPKLNILLLLLAAFQIHVQAIVINGNTVNYQTLANGLLAGDTLVLAAGNYPATAGLQLANLAGTALKPIVITGAGNTTVFPGDPTQNVNTIEITNCAYLVIENLEINGNGV